VNLTRVAVILHERIATWARQLRPRLHGMPVRWFETRSQRDLESVLLGLARPVVLLDFGKQAEQAVKDLNLVLRLAPDARVLVLDPEERLPEAALARELGATHVASGFVAPPFVSDLLARWVRLAQTHIGGDGWSQTSFPPTQTDPWSWLDDYLADPAKLAGVTSAQVLPRPGRRPLGPSEHCG
jgi:hypothetical protein